MRKIVSLNDDELILIDIALDNLLKDTTSVIEQRALNRLSDKIKNHLKSMIKGE